MTPLATRTGLLGLVLVGAMVAGACASNATTPTAPRAVNEDVVTDESSRSTSSGAEILLRDVALAEWNIDAAANVDRVGGKVLLNGAGVAGAIVQVDDYTLPDATGADGSFTYPADVTVPHRYIVKVIDANEAEVGGERLSDQDVRSVEATRTGFNVAYGVENLDVRRENRSITVTGRLVGDSGASLPPLLFAFSLTGQVTGPSGEPVSDVWVSFRPADRETWTLDATDANGRFHSFFFPSTESTGAGPYSVIVSKGASSWEAPDGVSLDPVTSATVDIGLPNSPDRPLTTAERGTPEPGAYYETVLVGLAVDGKVLIPSSASWLDREGQFSLVFPADEVPQTASIWVSREYVFVDGARPGAEMDLSVLPSSLAPDVPRGIRDVRLLP
jgi:hypothetical protein